MDRESVGSSGSGRETPRSLDRESYRSLTPGSLPTYQYSKDELYELEKEPASQVIPACLDKEFMVDGIWDPEKWHRSLGGGSGGGNSRGPSPLTGADPRERRIEISSRRHSGSERPVDPKERLKEEKDGIVLSPQRRSFGTGCHVTHQPLLQRALSNILDGDRERRDTRRIGSGRIQIDRERGGERESREYGQERERAGDRERERDFRSERRPERDRGDYRSERGSVGDSRDFRRDSERERDFRNPRERYDKDDRERDTRFERDRDRLFISRRDLDERARERDFRDFSNRHYNNRRDRRDSHHREEEPEWFSSGPVSKNDTIELHGFERQRRESERTEPEKVEEVDEAFEEEDDKHQDTGISVTDRNGSLETNESSSPETNPADQTMDKPSKTPPPNTLFDFNEFFKIENIPGLNVPLSNVASISFIRDEESSSPETNPADQTMDKPSKTPPPNTLFDFNEFFKIENIPGLNDDPIIDQELPSIGGSRFFQQYIMSTNQGGGNRGSRENSRRSSAIEDEFGYLNDLLNGSKSPVIPSPPPPSANSVFDRSDFLSPYAVSDKQQNIEFGTVGNKVNLGNNPFVTALINNAINRASPPNVLKNSPQDTEAKLKAILLGRMDSTSSSGNTTPGFNSPLNLPGKVKTLAELEGELQHANKQASVNQQQRMGMTQPTVPRSSPQPESNDLSAFNKLISLMQAGTARPVESPKLNAKPDPRPASPLANLTAHLQQASIQQHQQQQQQQSGGLQQRVIHKPEPLHIPPQHMQAGHPGNELQPQYGSMENLGTPTNIPPPQQQNMSGLGDANLAKKEFLEALQRNKEQQLQLRQMALQNMRMNQPQAPPPSQPPPQMAPPTQQPPQQQPIPSQQPVNTQPGMNQRRLSNGDPIMNFLKANPTIITKPASPTPPPQQVPSGPPQPPTINMPGMNQRRLSNGDPIMNFLKANPTIITKPASPTPPPQQVPSGPPQPPTINMPGMNQRRLSNGDPIMNFLKANPTIITKPASPTPPPQQVPSGPPQPPTINMVQARGPSPSPILQQALLSQQNPGSPRVPSPIMFSQQPPMHLSAPSPIHPSQSGSLAQSPTTLQPNVNASNSIRPPSVPRVPSPQELIAHTQAILQNALIKKQLEDQKERFYKKQAERGKSPNAAVLKDLPPSAVLPLTLANQVTSTPLPTTPINKTPVNVAFTPTSVIRKMHSEKASEKEKQRRDSIDAEAQDKQALPDTAERVPNIPSDGADLNQPLSSSAVRSEPPPLTTTNVPPPKVIHAYPPPPLPGQVLPNMLSVMPGGAVIPGLPPPSFSTNQLTHLPPPPPPLISTHIPPPLLSPGTLPPPIPNTSLVTQEQIEAAKSQQIRALIGPQGPVPVNIQTVTSGLNTPGRPIIKGNLTSVPQPVQASTSPVSKDGQHRPIIGTTGTPVVSAVDMAKLLQQQQQRQFSVPPRTPTTPSTPFGIPITGRVPLQSTPMLGAPQPPTPGANPILMQQVIPGGNPRAMNQLTQLANYQAQQRLIDPRGIRPPLPAGMVPQLSPRSVNSYPTPVSNNPLTTPFNPRTMNPNIHKNGPISPGHMQSPMISNGNNNILKQESANLVKWFGSDMLKNQLPTMPPLSIQGQKVLTLDELERS